MQKVLSLILIYYPAPNQTTTNISMRFRAHHMNWNMPISTGLTFSWDLHLPRQSPEYAQCRAPVPRYGKLDTFSLREVHNVSCHRIHQFPSRVPWTSRDRRTKCGTYGSNCRSLPSQLCQWRSKFPGRPLTRRMARGRPSIGLSECHCTNWHTLSYPDTLGKAAHQFLHLRCNVATNSPRCLAWACQSGHRRAPSSL